MKKIIERLYNKKISGYGLAVFRIVWCLNLLCEIAQLYYFRHLVYDKVPYIDVSEINIGIPIVIWGISVIFILFGLFTRFATILNYLLSVILIGSIHTFEYHMFYAYMGINFLLMFLPISRNLSIDRLLQVYKYSNTRFTYNPTRKVSVLSYYIPILVGVAFVYFDSIFFKYSSSFWPKGLGMWLPCSVPFAVFIPLQELLNQKYLILGAGYLTLVFETVFLFTFFRKKWRLPILIVGLGLHIGILISYPIPWFAIGMCAIYLLMMPVSFWEKIFEKKTKKPVITFYYDAECPLCARTKNTIQHFDVAGKVDFKTVQYYGEQDPLLANISLDTMLDNIHSVKNGKVYEGFDTYVQVFGSINYLKPLSWLLQIPGISHLGKTVYGFVAKNRNTERCTEENCGFTPPVLPPNEEDFKILKSYTLKDLKIKGITIGLFIIILLQMLVSYNSQLNIKIRRKIGVEYTVANKKMENFCKDVIEKNSKIYLGITNHAVFMDYHFKEYNHEIAVVYQDKNNNQVWLPIIDKDGTSGDYLYGFNWVKWSFRVNNNKINQKKLEKGIRDFTAFWAKKNNVDLTDATFIIKVKKIEIPTEWEKDFLKQQMEKPWLDIGKVNWHNKQYQIQIPEVEKL